MHLWQSDASPMHLFVHLTSTSGVSCSHSTCLGFVLYTSSIPTYLSNHHMHLEYCSFHGYGVRSTTKLPQAQSVRRPSVSNRCTQSLRSRGGFRASGNGGAKLHWSTHRLARCKICKAMEENMSENVDKRKWDNIGRLLGSGPIWS